MNVESVKQRVVSRISIPSLPTLLLRIDEMMRDPDAGVHEISKLVGQDPPLAARVLRIANSSYYGLRAPVVTVEHAASVLGLNALRNILLQVSVFQAWGHLAGNASFDLPGLWKHSVLTGHLAAALRQTVRGAIEASPEEMYVAGLLHDIGKFVLLDTFPQEFLKAAELAREQGQPLYVLEREVLGLAHTHVGALLAKRWSLPESVVAAIQNHHDTAEAGRKDPLVAVVVVANELSRAVLEKKPQAIAKRVAPETLELLGLDLEKVLEVGRAGGERLDELAL